MPSNSALRLAESVLKYSLEEASLPVDVLPGVIGILSMKEVKDSYALSASSYCSDNMVCFSSKPVSEDLKARYK